MDNGHTVKSIRDKAVRAANLGGDALSVNQTTKVQIVDLHPFLNNKAIQINSLVGVLTMDLSNDGVVFSNSSTPSTGITAISLPCRYVRLTIATGVGNLATGVVTGSLY